ncbi:hypothetical protein RSOL_359770, partial [Rhizoctonia solani AG-3 Rhs1AP]
MGIETQHQAAASGITPSRKRTKRCFDEPRSPLALRTTSDERSDSLPDPPVELISGENSAYIEYLEPEDEDEDLEGEDEMGARNLTGGTAQLNQALDNDNNEKTGEEALPEPEEIVANQPCAHPRRLRLYFSKAHAIPLSEVFNLLESVDGVEEGLGIYWKGGVANLAEEHDVYEAIASMRN